MTDFLIYLVTQIVDNPDSVVVTETLGEGITNYAIKVNPSDMGKVIGKSGRIIKALRDLARILAIKRGLRINVLLQEE